MTKQGTQRPERTHTKPKNQQGTVPEIHGKPKLSETPPKEHESAADKVSTSRRL